MVTLRLWWIAVRAWWHPPPSVSNAWLYDYFRNRRS